MAITEGSLDTGVTLVPRWLRMAAAVKYSGLSKSYLYPAISEGKIRSVCLRAHEDATRGIRLVDRLSLDEFILTQNEAAETRIAAQREKIASRRKALAARQTRLEQKAAALESNADPRMEGPNPGTLVAGVRTPLDI